MATPATRILYNDPCEYYFVCDNCWYEFHDMQFAGSTEAEFADWRAVAEKELADHRCDSGECEFCGIDGNGGWMKDGEFPAARRRDRRLAALENDRYPEGYAHPPDGTGDGM